MTEPWWLYWLNLFKHFFVVAYMSYVELSWILRWIIMCLIWILFILHATLMVCFKANSAVPRSVYWQDKWSNILKRTAFFDLLKKVLLTHIQARSAPYPQCRYNKQTNWQTNTETVGSGNPASPADTTWLAWPVGVTFTMTLSSTGLPRWISAETPPTHLPLPTPTPTPRERTN